MHRSIKILLVILLYLLIGFSFFALIAYFKNINIFGDINYQLYAGVGCVIFAIIDIIFLGKKEKKLSEVEENIPENTENNQDDIDDSQENEENISKDDICLQKISNDEIVENANNVEEKHEVNFDCMDKFADESIDNQEEIESDDHTDEETDDTFVDNQEEISSNEESLVKVNADLTQTQIMYINKSENSYINDKGMPQLMVTNELSKDKIDSYEQIYQKQKEVDLETQKKADEEEEMYLRLEKYENIIHILTIIIVLLVLANLAIGAYYLYLRLF